MTPALEIVGLRVIQRDAARTALLHDVSLSVAAGRALAIVGASGSGKTLTLRSVLRLLPPTVACAPDSVIRVHGVDVASHDEAALPAWRAATFGIVPASSGAALDPVRRIDQQFAITAAIAPARTDARDELLRLVGFADPRRIALRFPHELSGGEQQRAALALALSRRPSLLLIDEPTSALDAIARGEVIALLHQVRAATDAAIVIVTHDLDVARAVADSAVVVHEGRSVESGAPQTLWSQPQHAATRALVDAWPRLPSAESTTGATAETPGDVLLCGERLALVHQRRDHVAVTALADASIVVRSRERVAIVGRSGSGKSSLARVIVGLDAPTAGRVTLRGAALPTAPARDWRRQVQWLMQDAGRSLDPRLTIGASLAEARRAHGLRADGDHARIDAALDEVGLAATLSERFPHELSSGQQQRAALARALLLEPECLILDEPVTALDPVSTAQIVALLDRIWTTRRLALVTITHDLTLVPQLADRVVVMHDGRVVEDGPAIPVLTRPSHVVTQALCEAQRRLTQ